jgi:hypothetical protein
MLHVKRFADQTVQIRNDDRALCDRLILAGNLIYIQAKVDSCMAPFLS